MLNWQESLAHARQLGGPSFWGGGGGGFRGMLPWEILKNRLSEMHFLAF